jgi:chaperone BCS1
LNVGKVVCGSGGSASWKSLFKPPRPPHTVYLCPEAAESITTIRKFFSQRQHYEQMNLPFQRVFLLWGPPGCGKSSYLQAIATQFELRLYYLQIRADKLGYAGLKELVEETCTRKCILVLEGTVGVDSSTATGSCSSSVVVVAAAAAAAAAVVANVA